MNPRFFHLVRMRRSAAPSQIGNQQKKARFNPPILKSQNADFEAESPKPKHIQPLLTAKIQESTIISSPVITEKRSAKDILTLIGSHQSKEENQTTESTSAEGNENSLPDKNMDKIPPSHEKSASQSATKPKTCPRLKPFKTPISFKPTSSASMEKSHLHQLEKPVESNEQKKTNGSKSLFFNVMWCKASKKKHKKWEGDAILITTGRCVSLLDMEGKEIGKASGYKISELETLAEGQSLFIGGKEIEIMGTMSEETYKSGKCFQSTSSPATIIDIPRKTIKAPAKPFQHHNLTDGKTEQAPVVVKPRFDPTAPDALVLAKPSHQTISSLVDVVVDPYLCRHLRPHQREGVSFLYECIMGMKNSGGQGAILADEMGLGKTLQCITVIWTLLRQGPFGGKPVAKRVLIITPGSLVKNWCREFRKWLGNERLSVFAVGQEAKPNEFLNNAKCPVMIVSYEMFVRYFEVIEKVKFDLIVCDEGHRLKNTTIKTTSLVMSLPCRRRIVLTGTPVQNDLQELFSLVDFCNPGILGSSSAFKHVYEGPILASRQPSSSSEEREIGQTRATELNRVTSLFILRRTADINNKYLPPKIDLVLFCSCSDLQRALYHKLLCSRVVRSCLSGKPDMAQHLMCISALKKLCNHPQLIFKNALRAAEQSAIEQDEGQLYQGLSDVYPASFTEASVGPEFSGKLMVVSQLLAAMYKTEPRERVVLVSNYTQTLDVLESLCKHHKYKFLRLDGQTPTGRRQHLVEQFNSRYSDYFVFLLSSKAGGVGLNLIGASRLILFDIDWNPANDLQAMARVWRDGQKRKVFIYRLITTGSLEEKIYQRQISKQALSGVVVDAKTDSKMHFSPDELRDLFKPPGDSLCETHDLLDCECEGHLSRVETSSETCRNRHQPSSMKKNVCMDELLEWNHVTGPKPQLEEVDPILSSQGDLETVTFAFWSESNNVSLE